MTNLLVLATALLSIALLTTYIKLQALRASIPDLITEGIDGAITDFKKRSGRTRVGTTVEQMVPFVKEMPFDPSDMRILSGGPVDYIVFDGLCEGNVKELVFLDVKTGKAKLNSAQKQVRQCADLGRVGFAIFEVDADGEKTYSAFPNARAARA